LEQFPWLELYNASNYQSYQMMPFWLSFIILSKITTIPCIAKAISMSKIVQCNSGKPNVAYSHLKTNYYNCLINRNQNFSFFHSLFSSLTFTYFHPFTIISPSFFSKILFYLFLPFFHIHLLPPFHYYSSFLFL
jgi:hypothetical protein